MGIKTRENSNPICAEVNWKAVQPYMVVKEGSIIWFAKTKKEAEERLRMERERLR